MEDKPIFDYHEETQGEKLARKSKESPFMIVVMEDKPIFDYHEETQGEKLARKSKESPFMIVGLAGLAASVGLGIYKYKHRGQMSTSVFLMQFRVIAQGAVVGALTAGMLYTLYNNQINKPTASTTNKH